MVARRLLIVDDEEAILFAMGDYFSQLGYAVDCAQSCTEAEVLLGGPPYEVVIADLRLASADHRPGLHLVRRVSERSPEARVIVLTAYGTPEVQSELQAAGVDLFLSKPQPLAGLAREVARLAAQGGGAASRPVSG